MNRAKLDVEGPNGTKTVLEEPLDPLLEGIWTPGPHPHASVAFSAGKALGYGELKLSAHVTLQCDQNEKALEQAATKAFEKTLHYLTAGFTMMVGEGKTG